MTMAGTSLSPLDMIAGEALEAHRLVKMDGSTEKQVVYADAGDRAVGVTLAKVASGDRVAVAMLSVGSTLKVISAGSITVNSTVYPANDGKVSDSVSGDPIGVLRKAGTADAATELLPYAQAGGDLDRPDFIVIEDDFPFFTDTDDLWTLDANNSGGVAESDAHGGVITLDASDGTAADNDESYLISTNEIYKPQAGKLATFKWRVKCAEAGTNNASLLLGLISHGTDVENTIADGGAGLADADTYMAFLKKDGGTVWTGQVRDDAQLEDTDVGSFTDDTYQELKIVVSSASGATEATVEFFVDGVSGGSLSFTITSATEMRVIFGIKNGSTDNQTISIDRFRAEMER